MRRLFRGISVGVLVLMTQARADIIKTRLTTFSGNPNSLQVINLINSKMGTSLKATDFAMAERTQLATMQFEMLVQMKGGQPIEGTRVRIWRSKLGQIIAAEAHIEKPSMKNGFGMIDSSVEPLLEKSYLNDKELLATQEKQVREAIANHHDHQISILNHKDQWISNEFVRVFEADGQRGVHTLIWSHSDQKIVLQKYKEFLQAELPPVKAMGYKIYEQNWYNPTETMEPEEIELKYLNDQVVAMDTDPYEVLSGLPLLRSRYDEQQGSTEEGIKKGYWSMALLQALMQQGQKNAVKVENGFAGPQGLVLDGRYVGVNIHPGAKKFDNEKALAWRYSDNLQQDMVSLFGDVALLFQTSYRGKTYSTAEELMVRPVRDPENSVLAYLKDGSDQVQVYWSVTEMMEQMHQLGFTDPEISTRKFQAFLYNPDPFYRNNAFYNRDTINFTTYTPDASNFARDNTTVWHELGHGVIDRLLGQITLTKGEGFHEGFADFLAELVVQSSSFQRDFPGRTGQRIYNVSAFNFANEAHDDGEAYGGFMKDVLDRAIALWGKDGLMKTAELTLEAMRFTRGHPALDEQEWVEKLLFADSRSSLRRAAFQFKPLIEASLANRNFTADGKGLAEMSVKIDDTQLTRGGVGGRSTPMSRPLGVESRFKMLVSLKDGANFKFKYPLKILVAPGGGANGPVDWVDEDLGSQAITIKSPQEVAEFNLGTTGKCDFQNVGESCRESIFIDVYSPGETKPRARQRVYMQLNAARLF
ncbi:MAG: hypothetical protein K2P81_01805 [Bacteriovoracaceae bacterium]|nr:hypothetical protein [Bacteriovoracaceae bacterium]